MPIEHVNRRGDRYYLLQGKTKTGKPKYYFSKKPAGVRVEAIPAGFEIRENPTDGRVTLRKVRPTRILPHERNYLAGAVRELAGLKFFVVDVEDDSLVVYTTVPDSNPVSSPFAGFFGGQGGGRGTQDDWIGGHSIYLPMLRFELIDADRRGFAGQRWCFRGSIDTWITVSRADSLESLASALLPHLGKGTFYELI